MVWIDPNLPATDAVIDDLYKYRVNNKTQKVLPSS